MSLGTGDLTIDANLIRGNFAEGGQGGGIRLQQVNGADVAARQQPGRAWHRVTITNNMIVNNVAGWAGGGISLADTLNASIANNTIASNDSTGIAGVVLAGGVPLPAATAGGAGMGYPSPAGIVSEHTSAPLLAQIPAPAGPPTPSRSPSPVNNILWQNRSFYYSGNGRLCAGQHTRPRVAGAAPPCRPGDDRAVRVRGRLLGHRRPRRREPGPGRRRLNPTYSVLTSTAGYGGRAATPRRTRSW